MKALLVFLFAFLALASAATLLQVKEPIQDRYIIVFHENTTQALVDLHLGYLGADNSTTLHHHYKHSLKGYAAHIPSRVILAKLMSDPIVDFVEPDQMMYATACTSQQNPGSWGLARLSNNAPGGTSYTYDSRAGEGVHAYIVDTGIRSTHVDFGTRVDRTTGQWYDAIGDGKNGEDGNGHGTHVASTVGGTSYGVAKKVTLHQVRVLNNSGSGTNSGVIAGVDFVRNSHKKPAVANMSLGGGASTALDNAVNNAANAGVVFVVAAGNDNRDAKDYSPARASGAITVASSAVANSGGQQVDQKSSFSNYGASVDLYAPGSSITAAWHTSNTATNTISGTSMASPHVAGVAALLLAQNVPASSVRTTLTDQSQKNVVTSNPSGTANRLLRTTCS